MKRKQEKATSISKYCMIYNQNKIYSGLRGNMKAKSINQEKKKEVKTDMKYNLKANIPRRAINNFCFLHTRLRNCQGLGFLEI